MMNKVGLVFGAVVLASVASLARVHAGTIDPSTIKARTIVRFPLAENSGDYNRARAFATDSAKNRIAGSVLVWQTNPNDFRPRSVISKFDNFGKLLWRRERAINTVYADSTTTYYETFSPAQTPVQISSDDANASLDLAAIATDDDNNVIVAFNQIASSGGPPTGPYQLYDTPRTLFVKFSASGKYLWRYLQEPAFTNGGYPIGFYPASAVKSLDVAADGSVLALIRNYQPNGSGVQGGVQTVFVKLAADGNHIATDHYGIGNTGAYATNVKFFSDPIALGRDASNNIYTVSVEYPNSQSVDPSKIINVIRKHNASGDVLARVNTKVYPTGTAGAGDPVEAWNVAKVDDAGHIYVAGTHSRASTSQSDPGESRQLVLKFGPGLARLWRSLGPQPTQTYRDQAGVGVTDIGISPNGVTVGGGTVSDDIEASNQDDRWELTRYAVNDGHIVWHQLYAGSKPPSENLLSAMRVDSDGNVYAAGLSSTLGKVLIKYASNGDLQFVKKFPANQDLNSLPASNLSLPEATNKPTFFGESAYDPTVFAAFEFSNPAVVPASTAVAPMNAADDPSSASFDAASTSR